MKKLIYFLGLILLCSFVLADTGMMGVTFGIGLIGLIYFAIGVFIFSVIFWLTYKWLVTNKKR